MGIPTVYHDIVPDMQSAFGDDLSLHVVPAGLAVGTSIRRGDGDCYGFYVIPQDGGRFSVEDDGATVGMADACGAGLVAEDGSATSALSRILDANGVSLDDLTVTTGPLPAADVGNGAFRLVSALQDIVAAGNDATPSP
jgi:hypothetical protein